MARVHFSLLLAGGARLAAGCGSNHPDVIPSEPQPGGGSSSSSGGPGSAAGSVSGASPARDSGTSSGAGPGGGSDSSSEATDDDAADGAGATPASAPDSGSVAASCGGSPSPDPFGCSFGWGINDPGGASLTSYEYLQFMSNWAGYDIPASGIFTSSSQLDAGGWLSNMAATTLVPAYYAYLIGYYGHANGLQDQNQNPNGPNLANGMGALLLGVDNAACPPGPPATICADNLMVKAYAWYAAQTYAVWKKPLIWLLEGDFIQYSVEGAQSMPLSYAQLGQLAAQITMAIKCAMPSAVIALNYSTWISTSQLDSYFGEIATAMTALGTSYDMVWTTGMGNSASAGNATYAALHALTGKPIVVDESFGLSAMSDTWADQSAAAIDTRESEGVVAANVTTDLPSYLKSNVSTTLAPSALSSTCH
jgi:hypothetical protein